MIMPPVVLVMVCVAVFAGLSTLNWLVGRLPFDRAKRRVELANSPRRGTHDSFKDAA
jgi:hypothetical protein